MITRSPLSLMSTMRAWSSRTKGSGAQRRDPGLLRREAGLVAGGPRRPRRSPRPTVEQETRVAPPRSRRTRHPMSARRLVVGISRGSPPRNRHPPTAPEVWVDQHRQARRPSARMSPSSPVVWSKCPWLQTIASMEDSSTSSRRMFSTTPSGLTRRRTGSGVPCRSWTR